MHHLLSSGGGSRVCLIWLLTNVTAFFTEMYQTTKPYLMQKEPNGQTVLKAQDWGLKCFSKMAATPLLPSYPPNPSYFVECLNLVMELNSKWSEL